MQQSLAAIDFTEEDFTLLREAIDDLARKQNEGSLVSIIMESVMDERNGQAFREAKKKIDDRRRLEVNDKIDKLVTLQYKVVQFRKYLKWASETPMSPNTHTEEAAGEAPTSPD